MPAVASLLMASHGPSGRLIRLIFLPLYRIHDFNNDDNLWMTGSFSLDWCFGVFPDRNTQLNPLT